HSVSRAEGTPVATSVCPASADVVAWPHCARRSLEGSAAVASVPALPAFHVERPRLLDLLDTGRDLPLTAVVAPPGAGKSITLAAWIRDRCPDAVWVACTERDRDPVAF